jgi:hypothetical protein
VHTRSSPTGPAEHEEGGSLWNEESQFPDFEKARRTQSYRPRSVSSLLIRLRAMMRVTGRRGLREVSGRYSGPGGQHVRLRLCVEKREEKRRRKRGKVGGRVSLVYYQYTPRMTHFTSTVRTRVGLPFTYTSWIVRGG